MTDSAPAQRPTAAGMYDYYLGGTENTPADRAVAEQVVQVIPPIIDSAWANRGFLQRAVRRMATDWGIRQFLDIGAGLPTQRNTHDVVAEVMTDGRVVYVDNDPVVVARGNELDPFPSGSYLALSHGSTDHQMSEELKRTVLDIYGRTPTPLADHTKQEIAGFFRGLEIVPPYPGAAPEVSFVGLWEAEDPEEADTEGSRWFYAAVARKP